MQRFLFLALLMHIPHVALGEGFKAGSLVKTPYSYVPIEEIQKNDKVICYDFEGKCIESTVTELHKISAEKFYTVIFGNSSLVAAHDQLFFLPEYSVWVEASELVSGDMFLKNCIEYVVIEDIYETRCDDEYTFDLTVEKYHNFCITHDDILVHNMGAVIQGTVSFVFDALLNPATWEGVKWGVGAGVAAFGGLYMATYNTKEEEKAGYGQRERRKRPCNPADPTPEDCYFENAGYHHSNSRGTKSPSPLDGPGALRNSVKVSTSPTSYSRVGISKGQYVVLNYTCNDANGYCVFHGHVRKWNELDNFQRSAYYQNGMTTLNGKILRDA